MDQRVPHGGSRFSPRKLQGRRKTRILTRHHPRSTEADTALNAAVERDAGLGVSTLAVGVSGGPDSVFLVRSLARLWRPGRPRLVVLSVDHGTRGAESREDVAFVARLAAELSLPFLTLRADPSKVFKAGRASEQRLRAERYSLFQRALAEFGAARLYLAHQRDDQLETIVLAALRGAGLRGLAGMARRRPFPSEPKNALPRPSVVRPLLSIPRSEIERSLHAEGIESRIDPSNLDLSFERNRIRHVVLPMLRAALGDRFDLRWLRLARLARILHRRAMKMKDGTATTTDALHARFEALAQFPLSRGLSNDLQRAFFKKAPVVLDVGKGVRITTGGGTACRTNSQPERPPARSTLAFLDLRGKSAGARWLRAFARTTRVPHRLDPLGSCIHLDLDRIRGPLLVRQRRAGDRYQPLGKGGAVKTKDLLIQEKIERARRDALIVLVDGDGIVAMEGLPPAARVAVTEATQRILRIRFVPCDETPKNKSRAEPRH